MLDVADGARTRTALRALIDEQAARQASEQGDGEGEGEEGWEEAEESDGGAEKAAPAQS